jgi:glycosyltransferase involved in cell wall biosynthesis
MRILIGSLRGTSGIATYTRSLVDGLASAGHEVVLVDETMAYETDDPRVTVARLPVKRPLPSQLAPFEGWRHRPGVARLARSHSVDVVHATHMSVAPRHPRLVITAWDPVRGAVSRCRAAALRGMQPAKEASYGLIDAVAVRRASAIVAVTRAVQKGVRRHRHRVELIPCFIDDDAIDPQPVESSDILFVARGVDLSRKGLDLAIQTVARARREASDARLVIVGGWADVARQDALPEFCEVRGTLSREELREALREAGCLLVASRWEEFGYVGLEALAVGTPVASAPLPAYDGISGGGVFMARQRSPYALAREVETALRCRTFEFPAECRSSVAIPTLVALYAAISGHRAPRGGQTP